MQLADGARTRPEEREEPQCADSAELHYCKQLQYVPFIEEISVNSPEQQEGKPSHKGGRFCGGRVQNEQLNLLCWWIHRVPIQDQD